MRREALEGRKEMREPTREKRERNVKLGRKRRQRGDGN